MMNLLTIFYGLCALLLAIYTLGHGVLLIQYLRHRKQIPPQPTICELPLVTVQLPIYNEQHVAMRLIDAALALDYPADKLHIQILDDSTDATSRLIAHHLRRYPDLRIDHIRRSKREGYKAGALAYGLSQAESPYIAIFDADFIPPRDFLQRTIPFLVSDESLGVVQTRWGHLNPDDNWLTRAQVLSIDTHFVIEQTGRNRSGWILPFNGTGGVWRAATIHDAGGWSDATLTEDLDLSFRAQLRGWRSLMLPQIIVPGELPPQLAAYRQQQARWAKGSSQCFRRLIIPIWQSELKLSSKLIATQHLAQYVPHVLMLVMLLLAPLLLLTEALQSLPLAPLGLIGLIPPLMYIVSQYDSGDR
jgi:cellulose synthase/poly-beta-1,6-N-acetylglucosamine synthase-like glycosyltransferase